MVVRNPNRLVPLLEHGDKLTRDEFERRYDAMPSDLKAELIEGIVYMASPLRFKHHGIQHGHLLAWLSHYSGYTPGTEFGINATVRLDLENEPQPDGCMIIDPAKGGQAGIDADGHIVNAPELVCEVSASTVSYDMHAKLSVYRRHQVREYIVWRVYDEAIDWFVLHGSSYEQIPADESGIRKSETFPGLWLDSAALLRGDLPAVFQTVQLGLASPEHAEFVKRLAR